jgi:hypothetical protein
MRRRIHTCDQLLDTQRGPPASNDAQQEHRAEEEDTCMSYEEEDTCAIGTPSFGIHKCQKRPSILGKETHYF